MESGECFKVNAPHVPAGSPPAIPCRCGGGFCKLLASKTPKNPGRRFYTCPSPEQCGFFKWYDGPTGRKISSRPVCPCGSGPCRRETVASGPNAGRSFFVCRIKKSFGACGFFQWEDEEGHHTSSSSSSSGCVSSSCAVDENSFRAEEPNMISEDGKDDSPAETDSPASGFTLLTVPFEENDDDQVTDDGTHHVLSLKPDKECPVSVPNPRSNDVAHHETGEEVLQHSLMEGDQLTKESYEWEVDEATSVLLSTHEYDTTSNETSSDHIQEEAAKHQPLLQSDLPFANTASLLDLVKQYHSEKFNFESVSLRCFEAFSGFVGSYKQLKSLHDKADRQRELLVQTEKQIACCEAETLEFVVSVQEVSGQMKEPQNRMQETAERLAKEIEVFKQRYCLQFPQKRD